MIPVDRIASSELKLHRSASPQITLYIWAFSGFKNPLHINLELFTAVRTPIQVCCLEKWWKSAQNKWKNRVTLVTQKSKQFWRHAFGRTWPGAISSSFCVMFLQTGSKVTKFTSLIK